MPNQRASEQRQLPPVGMDKYLDQNAGEEVITIPTPHTQRFPTLGSSDENQGNFPQHTEENLLDDHSLERQLGEAPFGDDEDVDNESENVSQKRLSYKKRSMEVVTTSAAGAMNIQEYEAVE